MICIISSRNHCQRFSSSYISDTPQPGFEPAHRLNSGFVEWIWAVPLNPIPQRQTADLVTFTKEIRNGKSQYATTKNFSSRMSACASKATRPSLCCLSQTALKLVVKLIPSFKINACISCNLTKVSVKFDKTHFFHC